MESIFPCAKGPYVHANMTNSVEDVGGGGVRGGGVRCRRIFMCLQYGNFMVLPQTIAQHHVPYRVCREAQGEVLSLGWQTPHRGAKRKKSRVFV